MKRIRIIGGGIAGLATAWYLQQKNTPLDVEIIEAADRVGGKIYTDRFDDLVLEGAPESLLTEKQSGLDLANELGIADQLLPSNDAKRSFNILLNGELVPFPKGHRLFIPLSDEATENNFLLSEAGKSRSREERHIPPRVDDADESLSDFVTRRFGREVMENMAAPLIAGIFGGDPNRLSILCTMPRMRLLEKKHGSLTQAFAQLPTSSKRSTFTSLKNGMAQLTETLASKLSCKISTGVQLHSLDDLDADQIIIAIPANRAATLLQATHPAQAELLKTWRYTSSGTLSLVYDRADITVPEGFGFMAPKDEVSDIIGATWTTNKFDHRAPADRFIARAFFGGDPLPDEASMLENGQRELQRIFGFDATPLTHRAYRWPDANPQYDVGHIERMAHLRADTDLLFIGSSYDGFSISDCITSAKKLADQF